MDKEVKAPIGYTGSTEAYIALGHQCADCYHFRIDGKCQVMEPSDMITEPGKCPSWAARIDIR
jgi:hypothetical protein